MSTPLSQTLTPGRRQLLGAATVWPPIYMGLFLVYWLTNVVGLAAGNHQTFLIGFAIVGVFHVFTMVLQFVLAGVYLWLVFEAELAQGERVMWALLVVFAGFIGQVFFLSRVIDPRIDHVDIGAIRS